MRAKLLMLLAPFLRRWNYSRVAEQVRPRQPLELSQWMCTGSALRSDRRPLHRDSAPGTRRPQIHRARVSMNIQIGSYWPLPDYVLFHTNEPNCNTRVAAGNAAVETAGDCASHESGRNTTRGALLCAGGIRGWEAGARAKRNCMTVPWREKYNRGEAQCMKCRISQSTVAWAKVMIDVCFPQHNVHW